MGPCPRKGTLDAWLFLAFVCSTVLAVERHYYIAAVNIDWDYHSSPGPQRSGTIYKKAVYREYEDATFKKAKPHPPELGLLGPTLHGQEGDVIMVTFRNMVDQPCNIHPHGIAYGKQSEGAFYFDNTSQKEKEDDVVHTGGSHTYYWDVTSAVTPQAGDPPCLTYTYFSHVDILKDYNSGLIGTFLICKAESLDDSGKQKHFHQENILLFGIFDESLGWYSKGGPSSADTIKYTINGYTNGTVPGLSVCAYSSVSWHFLGMSSTPEVFSIHFNGQVFSQDGHRVSSLGIISGTTTSASMTAVHAGRWLISSYVNKHLEGGMHGFLEVKTCESFKEPERKLTIQQKRDSQMWTYYIAAEEVLWDYTPNMPDYIDPDFRSKYLKQGPHRIGKKYRKAVFTQYTDDTFTKRAEDAQRKMELGIIGPVIRAQIRDQIKIVFKNKATRPYSIYPHGLTIDKAGEGANYPEGGNQTHAVQPGDTHTYVWNVIEEDEPLADDPRCLTRMYHSAVNTPRDIASGLVGPLLICKSQSLNKRNVQMKADKEQHAMFAVFDENKSWYLDENIKEYCSDPPRVRKDAPDFYESNVMHTINGYMYDSGQVLGFCTGEIVTWHVSSVGEQKGIQTATFYGHTFEVNNREEDFLTLFPMTGETVSMNMDNKGDWLLSSLTSHDTTKGMRVKFKDVECFRDYVYEYEEGEGEYNMWKAEDIVIPDKKNAVEDVEDLPLVETAVDTQTDYWASLLDIRSHKKTDNATAGNLELLDLSKFDYLDDLMDKKNSTLVTQRKASNSSDSESSSPSVMDVIPASEVAVNNTITAPWNESLSINTTKVTPPVSSVNDTKGDSINSAHIPFNATWLTTTVSLLSSPSETPVVPTVQDDPLPSSNTYVYEYKEGEGEYNTWKAKDNVIPDKKNAIVEDLPLNETAVDTQTDYWASLLDIRSHKKTDNATAGNLELLDVSEFDYLDDLMGKKNSTLVTQRKASNNSDSESSSSSVMDVIPASEVAVNNTITAPWNESLSINTTKVTPSVSSVNDTKGDFINSTSDFINFINSTSRTTVSLLANPSETPVPLTVQDDPLPSSNTSVNETETVYMLSNMSKVPDHARNDPQSSKNITAGGSVDSNKTEQGFTYLETSLETTTESLNETDTEIVLLDGDAPTDIRQIEEEVGSDTQGSSSLYDFVIDVPGDINRAPTADDILNPGDLLVLSATDDTEIGTLSEDFIEKMDNESLPQVRVNVTHSPDEHLVTSSYKLESDKIGEITPVNMSSSENVQNISLSNSSSESIELAPVNASRSSKAYSNASQESEDWSSSEEVVIYLKHNTSEGVKTYLGHPKEHWGYEGKHEPVPMEIPEDLTKYIQNESKPKKDPKKKVVHRRVRPLKGHAMKTRKKKEYKPQPRSSLGPRGFQPRGARPISNEEDILNKAIVIGVPRPDFNDYDLFAVPEDGQDVLSKDEYEYIEYKDPYSQSVQTQGMTLDEMTEYLLKHIAKGTNVRKYYLSAEEVEWDYGGYGQRRYDMELQTKFTKVVYRGYLDPKFKIPDIRGEVDEHLGILGPVIRAEVGDTILVTFRNLASRPYSIHANGVTYGKQMEGLDYEDGTPHWYQDDNHVRTNETYSYMWTVSSKVGPKDGEPDCRTWAYYSGVNPERDINSGLIGPLLICRRGTISKKPLDTREFVLLFMTFDENRSWYYEKNYEMIQRRSRITVMDPLFKENIRFPAINGIIYGLKGLRMYTNQLANWHLINMGAANDVQSIHFHGQTFLNHQSKIHRQAVYPLLPGGFHTVQMWPSKPGLWLLESEVGLSQKKGMQTLFLVIDKDCNHPLGLISGSIPDNHIKASDTRGSWEPHLARLHNSGKYNAWSTDEKNAWIQVHFQRPVVISKVATQGANEMFSSNYVVNYTISYSNDRKTWIFYKGDSDTLRKTFEGNKGAHEVKENIFYPPLIGRYVRLHPLHSYNKPTVRMEFYGCELDGCSIPLGMKSGEIRDQKIQASSAASSWYAGTWEPWLARLDRQGTVNAWQAKNNDLNQWLQIELKDVKKITGIITQGAKSLGTKMFVTAYILEYSKDGVRWTKYSDDSDYEVLEFKGNTDNNDHKKNYIYPPIFAKFIRIVPRRWSNSITMRVELLGCDWE